MDTTQRQVQISDVLTLCIISEAQRSPVFTVAMFLFLPSTCVLLDEAVDQSDGSPDFYINICQPLNPIPGVTCPPGAAVCMGPDSGPPVVRLMNTAQTVVVTGVG